MTHFDASASWSLLSPSLFYNMNPMHSQLYLQSQVGLMSPFSDMGNESIHSQQFNVDFLKTMQNQTFLIQSITEQQLRASGNMAFTKLEKENRELRERVDDLQTQLLKYALSSSSPLLPSSSSSSAASLPPARPKITLKQVDYPLVRHWNRRPNDSSQLAVIKVTSLESLSGLSDDDGTSESEAQSDSDSNNQSVPQKRRKKNSKKKSGTSKRDGVPAYLEDENGKVINLSTKTIVYNNARSIWNQRIDLRNPPPNWSSAGADLRDEFRDVLEEKHPFLQLCSHRWKVEEIWKRNYHSWLKARLKRLDKPSPLKKAKPSVTDESQSAGPASNSSFPEAATPATTLSDVFTAGPASNSSFPEAVMPTTTATLSAGPASNSGLPEAATPALTAPREQAPPAAQDVAVPTASNARKEKSPVLPQVKNNSSNQCDPLLAAIHIDIQSLEDRITGHSKPDENTASISTPTSPTANQPSASVSGPIPNEPSTPSMGTGPTSDTPTTQASTPHP
ncbi:hypothetical protein E1B28_003379 [Marasmius oreades]|uniref:Uncharacterized protein n=1 Tax=Marasmius oreades TaxID=181124 RepID=A0A9P7RLU1_9AGAR|nr:uncharacterized protein E1B28_003379 [Marasmius oreades]KAG7085842.1 hypothetical protein E1B28_003379 [Marasmius oreades]